MVRLFSFLALLCMSFFVSAGDNLVLTQEDRVMLLRLQKVEENSEVVKELLAASQVVGPLTASGPLELTITLAQLDLSGMARAAMSMDAISRCRMRDQEAMYVAENNLKRDRYGYWRNVIDALDSECDRALDRR